MPLDTADCRCVVCHERFRVEAAHRGRRVACPHCLAQQLPQVIPANPGTTTTKARKPGTTSGTTAIRRPMATVPTTPIDPASLALFICATCGFRARVPAQQTEMVCPRCSTPGRAVLSGIPPSSGTTVVMTRTAPLDLPAATPADMPSLPMPRTPSQRPLAIVVGILGMVLILVLVALGLTMQQAASDQERLRQAQNDVEGLRNDLEQLRIQMRRLADDLAVSRAAQGHPISAEPGTTTSH